MSRLLYGLARLCVRRRYVVIGVWLLVTVALVVVSHRLGDNTNDNLSLPGTDSQHATDTLAAAFPDQANGTSPIVLHAHSGKLTEQRYASAVDEAAAAVAKAPNVAAVVNPLTPAGAAALSKDGATGYLSVDSSPCPPASCPPTRRSASSTRRPRRRPRGSRSRPAASSARRSQSPRPSPAS
jgi:RND superfamily putative drug exporter